VPESFAAAGLLVAGGRGFHRGRGRCRRRSVPCFSEWPGWCGTG